MALKFLQTGKELAGHLARWILETQEYDFEILIFPEVYGFAAGKETTKNSSVHRRTDFPTIIVLILGDLFGA